MWNTHGIRNNSVNLKNSGNSVQPLGKIEANKTVFGVQKMLLNTFAAEASPQTLLGELELLNHFTIITICCCCDNLWKSKFMAPENPGKVWGFFS